MDEVYRNDDAVVDKALKDLMMHFDAVQVFTTRHEVSEDGPRTIGITKGGGNHFSRLGIVRDWLENSMVDNDEYRDDYVDPEHDDPADED